MNLLFISSYLLHDFFQYKTAFYQQQTGEKAEAKLMIKKAKKSAKSLLSLISSRIEADPVNLERIQKILSSSSQIANDLGLPGILNASFRTYSKPFVKVTRFGARPVDAFTPLDNSIKAKLTLRNDIFKVTRAISDQYPETVGSLTISFDKNKLMKGLGEFETINPEQSSSMEEKILINGVDFYSSAPAEFWEYGTQNINKYFVFAFFSFLTTLSIFALYIALHRRFERKYGKLISKLKLDIEGFVHSEFDNQNYRTAQTTLKRVRSLLVKRQLEQIQHVYTCLDHLVTSQSDPGHYLSEEDGLKLITMGTSSLETIAMGLISPLTQEDVELSEIGHL